MTTPATALPTIRTATPAGLGTHRISHARPLRDHRGAERLLAMIRTTLVVALSALMLAIGALAYLVSFEAIRAFAIQTAAFPPPLAWTAPLLVDSFTTAATLVILWRYLRGEPWVTSRSSGEGSDPGREVMGVSDQLGQVARVLPVRPLIGRPERAPRPPAEAVHPQRRQVRVAG